MSNAKTFQEWAKEILPIVQAAANGEPIEVMNSGKWVDKAQHLGFDMYDVYRVKPKTIRIGKYDVPEPLRKAPVLYAEYFVCNVFNASGYCAYKWFDGEADRYRLYTGMVHSTAEAASLHARAIISLTGAEL